MRKRKQHPSRPITIVVLGAAGGPGDALARFLAEPMRASLGQQIIIENVSGANGTIGTARVVRAAADGYTLSLGNWNSHMAASAFYPVQYDILKDLDPISLLTISRLWLVSKMGFRAKVRSPEESTRLVSSRDRCLTDGLNFLWVYSNEEGLVSGFKRWAPNGNPQRILCEIADPFDIDIVSEYEPEFWGYETTEEWDADWEAMAQKDEQDFLQRGGKVCPRGGPRHYTFPHLVAEDKLFELTTFMRVRWLCELA